MGQEPTGQEKIIAEFHEVAEPLLVYLPWLEQHAGQSGSEIFGGQGIAENSLCFPVYDATLMRFVKEVGKTSLMDRNYRYVYSRNHIQSHEDERALILRTNWRSWDQLKGVLSFYVLGGRVKASLWSEGVKANIYLMVLKRMQEIASSLEAKLSEQVIKEIDDIREEEGAE
ncbi:MAG: hypothetical protein J6Z22_09990 [Lachnospiraceae bacterium]|nr:hypothetical protein [Lachnospiraceae bacterium]